MLLQENDGEVIALLTYPEAARKLPVVETGSVSYEDGLALINQWVREGKVKGFPITKDGDRYMMVNRDEAVACCKRLAKHCNRCKSWKWRSQFHKDRVRYDGLQNYCITCFADMYAAASTERAQHQAEYRAQRDADMAARGWVRLGQASRLLGVSLPIARQLIKQGTLATNQQAKQRLVSLVSIESYLLENHQPDI